ncbi:hypothetical protein TNCV_3071581 [Trichonephila clavipes]|nr:hypothetical protein TNCV_3071581 [Trichonephila clavipes]
MDDVNFLHHENASTWAGVEPASLSLEGKRHTNRLTHPAINLVRVEEVGGEALEPSLVRSSACLFPKKLTWDGIHWK